MSMWTRLKAFGPWSRAQQERDLEREIQNHLDLEAEESGPSGARRAFGSATALMRFSVTHRVFSGRICKCRPNASEGWRRGDSNSSLASRTDELPIGIRDRRKERRTGHRQSVHQPDDVLACGLVAPDN